MNNYLTKLASNEDEKRLTARLYELLQKAGHGTAGLSDFLDLRQQELAMAVAANEPAIGWRLYGGYEEAERKRLLAFPGWQTEADARIAYLKINCRGCPEEPLSHRDYLGAILNLGIKREKLGDIVLQNSGAILITDIELADYISQQLSRIKRSHVEVERICDEDFIYEPPELTTLQVSLASLRLDTAVAAAYNLSRSAVDRLVEGGQVKLNHKEIYKGSVSLKPGDLITVRGQGRFRLEDVGGLSRKGRYRVRLSWW